MQRDVTPKSDREIIPLPWFRVYVADVLHERWFSDLTDDQRLCWFYANALARDGRTAGKDKETALRDLAHFTHRDADYLRGHFDQLVDLGLLDDGDYRPSNWDTQQSDHDCSTGRSRESRARKRAAKAGAGPSAEVQRCREEETRADGEAEGDSDEIKKREDASCFWIASSIEADDIPERQRSLFHDIADERGVTPEEIAGEMGFDKVSSSNIADVIRHLQGLPRVTVEARFTTMARRLIAATFLSSSATPSRARLAGQTIYTALRDLHMSPEHGGLPAADLCFTAATGALREAVEDATGDASLADEHWPSSWQGEPLGEHLAHLAEAVNQHGGRTAPPSMHVIHGGPTASEETAPLRAVGGDRR